MAFSLGFSGTLEPASHRGLVIECSFIVEVINLYVPVQVYHGSSVRENAAVLRV